MTELDESLALTRTAPNAWSALADPRREANTGMYGGWTAALLLSAVRGDAVDEGVPVSLTVHYLSLVPPGSRLALKTRRVGASRALATWQVELAVEGGEGVSAFATVVLAKRRETLGFTDEAMPLAPPPDTLPVVHPPGTFGERSAIRPVRGFPIFGQADSRIVFWARETSGRALDAPQLAYLADNYPPRVWSRRPEPGPYSTVVLAVYFHATEAELAAAGDDDVLMEVWCSRSESATSASHGRLWSRGGALLATTEQLGWYR